MLHGPGRALALLAVSSLALVSCSSDSAEPQARASEPITTAAETTTTAVPVHTAAIASEAEVDPAYRQGLARTEDGWIFSLNDGLFRTDEALNKTIELLPAIPDELKLLGFDHIGDIDVAGGILYVPLEQPDYELAKQMMLTYDAATLAYIDGRDVPQHHNSFVTVDPETRIAYSMDLFGSSALLRYDIDDDWRALDPLPMTTVVERVQGGDVYDGAVWLSTDDATDGVYRVDLETGAVQALGSIGHVDGEGEGIDATPTPNGDLHVLTIDVNIVPVRLIELEVSARP